VDSGSTRGIFLDGGSGELPTARAPVAILEADVAVGRTNPVVTIATVDFPQGVHDEAKGTAEAAQRLIDALRRDRRDFPAVPPVASAEVRLRAIVRRDGSTEWAIIGPVKTSSDSSEPDIIGLLEAARVAVAVELIRRGLAR
jgi:hypothetical protein